MEKCCICNEHNKIAIRHEKQWTAYPNNFFGDETHLYLVCVECLKDMIEGKPLKGKLKHFIKSDANHTWFAPDPREMSSDERSKLTKDYEERLIKLHKDACY